MADSPMALVSAVMGEGTAIGAGPGGLVKGRACGHLAWGDVLGHSDVCEVLPPRERVLEDQGQPSCDASGLGPH